MATEQEKQSGLFVQALADSLSIAMAYVGAQLGLYEALSQLGHATPAQLAERTGTVVRYVQDWLINQAAAKFVSYDAERQVFYMTEAQKGVLTESNPGNSLGTLELCIGLIESATHKIPEEMKAGRGIPWSAHGQHVFKGCERHYATAYHAYMQQWLEMTVTPSILQRLKQPDGVPLFIADVGCGFGTVVRLLAKAYPAHIAIGFDLHALSIEQARARLSQEPVPIRNAFFAECAAYSIPEPKDVAGVTEHWHSLSAAQTQTEIPAFYDVISICDALHDMCDPLAVLKSVRARLAPGGVLLVIEPIAHSKVEDNFNAPGQLYAAASVITCLPCGLAGRADGEVPTSENLGTLAPSEKYEDLAPKAGFGTFKIIAINPGNRIFGFYV